MLDDTLTELNAVILPPLVTALPVSPKDGQIIYYQASSSAGAVWVLRYNATSGSSYKWEYVGGSALTTSSSGLSASSSTTADTDSGLSIVLPALAGDFLISGFLTFTDATAAHTVSVGGNIGGVLTAYAFLDRNITAGTDARGTCSVTECLCAGAAASSTAKLVFHLNTATASVTVGAGSMSVVPVRVG